MHPAFWIAIMAVLGAALGYLIFSDAGVGIVGGVIVGALVYNRRREVAARVKEEPAQEEEGIRR